MVDLPRSAGRATNSEDIEELNWPSGAGSGTPDVFPHFDLGTTPGTVSGTFLIDNPSTSAANDTIGAASRTVFRFDSQHDITGWTGAPSKGRLMNRYRWRVIQDPNDISEYTNPDKIIRVNQYQSAGVYKVEVMVARPSDPDNLPAFGPAKRVVVNALVTATFTTSPATSVQVGQTLTLTVTSSGPSNLSRVFAVDWGDGVVTGPQTGTSFSHVYGASGSKTIILDVRDANDPSNANWVTKVITVTSCSGVANANTLASKSFPTSIVQGQYTAVSARFTNAGCSTWAGTGGYKLKLMNGLWNPFETGMTGTVPIPKGAAYTFNYSIRSVADPGTYPSDWQMAQNTAVFGAMAANSIRVFCPKAGCVAPSPLRGGLGASPSASPLGELALSPADTLLHDLVESEPEWLNAQLRETGSTRVVYASALTEGLQAEVLLSVTVDPLSAEVQPFQAKLPGLTVSQDEETSGGWKRVTLRLSQPGGEIDPGELIWLPIQRKAVAPPGSNPIREVRVRLVR